jgi:hypothetical protein
MTKNVIEEFKYSDEYSPSTKYEEYKIGRGKNLCGKTVSVDNPYEIYQHSGSGFEWRVLKKYQMPHMEKANPYARWFCAVKSPATHGSWEYGDVYRAEVIKHGERLK